MYCWLPLPDQNHINLAALVGANAQPSIFVSISI